MCDQCEALQVLLDDWKGENLRNIKRSGERLNRLLWACKSLHRRWKLERDQKDTALAWHECASVDRAHYRKRCEELETKLTNGKQAWVRDMKKGRELHQENLSLRVIAENLAKDNEALENVCDSIRAWAMHADCECDQYDDGRPCSICRILDALKPFVTEDGNALLSAHEAAAPTKPSQFPRPSICPDKTCNPDDACGEWCEVCQRKHDAGAKEGK